MKFLFVVTSYWAYGELTIALQFAAQLSDEHDIVFWVPRKQEESVRKKGFRTAPLYIKMPSLNKVILKDLEKSFQPDFILLSDFLNYSFCEKHYGLTMDDLANFSGNIGAFDLYNLTEFPRAMDTYGFKNKRVVFNEDIIKFSIFSCPILPAVIDKSSNRRFSVSLTNNFHIRTEEEKILAKKKLGFPSDRNVILTTTAEWQSTYKKYDRAAKFVSEAECSYNKIIEALVEDNCVISIGSNRGEMVEGVRYLKSVDPEVFDLYVAATDLFISRNIISTSFANIILKGIKGVLLQNSIQDENKYVCKMYPVGWFDFVSQIEKENDYMQLFTQTEMFQIEESVKMIKNMLESDFETDSNRKRLMNYHKNLKKLIKPEEIFRLMVPENI